MRLHIAARVIDRCGKCDEDFNGLVESVAKKQKEKRLEDKYTGKHNFKPNSQ